MRIEFSVRTAGGDRDLAVTAPRGTPLRQLSRAIAVGAGQPANRPLWLGDRPLDDLGAWGDGPLRRGALLTSAPRPPDRAGVLALHVVGGPAAGRVVPLGRGRIVIGRDPACDLVIADPDLSRRHVEIDVGAVMTVRDLGSTNGTRVDGRPIGGGPSGGDPIGRGPIGGRADHLRPGQPIRVGDTLVTVAGPEDSPASVRAAAEGTVQVLRPPREAEPVVPAVLELPTRPPRARPGRVQWAAAALPAAAAVALAWFAGSPQFLLFALLSPVMLLSTALGDRWHWRRSRRRDGATYNRRRRAADEQVASALKAETASRRRAFPDPAAAARIAALPGSRLWARRLGEADHLVLRMGFGDLASSTCVREGATTRPAGELSDVPLAVDLRAGPLGLAGPAEVIDGSADWLVAQLAVHHSPADLDVVVLAADARAERWRWVRWLPHLRAQVATGVTARELAADLLDRAERRRAAARGGQWGGPWLVIVADRVAVADCPGLAELLADGPAVGVTALCLAPEPACLPAACHSIARVCGDTGTRIAVRTGAAGEVVAVADRVSTDWAERLGRDLAPLTDPGVDGRGRVPPRCTLLEVLGPEAVDPSAIVAGWRRSTGDARARLGLGADGPVEVDLTLDGPHTLIAGTTGAGKSELLQTLVAGLAVAQPPDELHLLLIDYKGGAAFASCAELPHTAGLVTDLDPYLTERALRSLVAELRRRERLLADAGAVDLAAYRATAAEEPISRLVIVVDEFATLAQELPDFVHGLIGVAQRGRSLGVHLVLATQRPGAAVSPEIRANTALRIGLRMTDPGESVDVLDAPDAAFIERSTPGRAYLRCGTSLTAVQIARPSARTPVGPATVTVESIDRGRDPDDGAASGETDLDRIVAAIRGAAERDGPHKARTPWRPPLPERLPAAELGRPPAPTTVRYARVDLPDEQRDAVLHLDLAAGDSLLLAGAGRSGRTSALTTIALTAAGQLPPSGLTLHVADAGGALAEAARAVPHAASVLGPQELTLLPRLLLLLARECGRRASQGTAPGSRTLLLIDGWEALPAVLSDFDVAACSEALAELLRAGAAAGVSVAVAGDRTVLAPRFSTGFAQRIALRLPDRGDYALFGIAARNVPTDLPSGRGLWADDGAALQIAHVDTDPGPGAVRARADEIAAMWHSVPPDRRAQGIRLRPLPPRVTLADLPADGGRLTIGLAGDEAECLRIDPFSGSGRLLIAGPPRSGRSTALRSLAAQARAAGISTVVAAPGRSPLAAAARALGLRLIGPDDPAPPPEPAPRTLVLVDDGEAFTDAPAGDGLTGWLRCDPASLAIIVAGRSEDLATSYRGIAAEVRRGRCGILLRPGPVDGELLGVRLPRSSSSTPAGRGLAVGEPAWGALFETGEPVPVQVAIP